MKRNRSLFVLYMLFIGGFLSACSQPKSFLSDIWYSSLTSTPIPTYSKDNSSSQFATFRDNQLLKAEQKLETKITLLIEQYNFQSVILNLEENSFVCEEYETEIADTEYTGFAVCVALYSSGYDPESGWRRRTPPAMIYGIGPLIVSNDVEWSVILFKRENGTDQYVSVKDLAVDEFHEALDAKKKKR
ncbi:hypothetical protein [Kiloniella sp.]|uniref:hypothetical protein n=1 Tax=Kiloniella sp. TaxID=1938587 RepID=UPI003A92816B